MIPARFAIALATGLALALSSPLRAGDANGAADSSRVDLESVRLEGLSRAELQRAATALQAGEVRSASGKLELPIAALPALLARLGALRVASGALGAELQWDASVDPPVLRALRGEPTRWESVRVVGGIEGAPGRLNGQFLARELRGRASPDEFADALSEWFDACDEAARPLAVASVESLRVGASGLSAGLRLDPGPVVQLSELEVRGLEQTRRGYVDRILRWRAGEAFRGSTWRHRTRALVGSGLFARVSDVTLERRGERYVAALEVEENTHNSLAGAVGYAGASRTWNGYLSLSLGNLFGTGRALGFQWERVVAEESRLRLSWSEPYLGPLPIGARVALEQEVRDSTFLSQRGELLGVWRLGFDLSAEAGVEWRRFDLGVEPAEVTERRSSVLGLTWNGLARFEGQLMRVRLESGKSRVRPPDGPGMRLRVRRGRFEWEGFAQPVSSWLVHGRMDLGGVDAPLPLSTGDVFRIGGAATLRGYREEAFLVRRYAIGRLEAGPTLPGAEERAYLFLDSGIWRGQAAADETVSKSGYGFGLESIRRARRLAVDLGFAGAPSLRDGRLSLRVETRF